MKFVMKHALVLLTLLFTGIVLSQRRAALPKNLKRPTLTTKEEKKGADQLDEGGGTDVASNKVQEYMARRHAAMAQNRRRSSANPKVEQKGGNQLNKGAELEDAFEEELREDVERRHEGMAENVVHPTTTPRKAHRGSTQQGGGTDVASNKVQEYMARRHAAMAQNRKRSSANPKVEQKGRNQLNKGAEVEDVFDEELREDAERRHEGMAENVVHPTATPKKAHRGSTQQDEGAYNEVALDEGIEAAEKFTQKSVFWRDGKRQLPEEHEDSLDVDFSDDDIGDDDDIDDLEKEQESSGVTDGAELSNASSPPPDWPVGRATKNPYDVPWPPPPPPDPVPNPPGLFVTELISSSAADTPESGYNSYHLELQRLIWRESKKLNITLDDDIREQVGKFSIKIEGGINFEISTVFFAAVFSLVARFTLLAAIYCTKWRLRCSRDRNERLGFSGNGVPEYLSRMSVLLLLSVCIVYFFTNEVYYKEPWYLSERGSRFPLLISLIRTFNPYVSFNVYYNVSTFQVVACRLTQWVFIVTVLSFLFTNLLMWNMFKKFQMDVSTRFHEE